MSQEIISVRNLSDTINENFGETVSQVLSSDTIGLDGGNVIAVRVSPDEKTCALESWTVTSEDFFVKTVRTMSQATRSEAIDFICQRVSVSIITVEELANLDSAVSSVKLFRRMGWNLNTHYTEIMTGMKSHLFNYHKMVTENGEADIEKAILSLDPELR